MAVSAKFLADFSQFSQAVEKAELKLTGLRSESGRVEKQLQRMGDSFSGKKIFADAELASKAVQGLGGVSKLTAGEQSRLNGIVTEAISKYKAMGLEAPKHLTAVADATKPVTSGFSSILNTLKSIGPALGITFSVGAITGFARSVGQFAGDMLDLEAQTGITTDRLQAFNFVGAGVGLTIDTITRNADQLAKRLGGDDKSVNEALEKLNLSALDLKQLNLDEVMFRIDESLVGVNNKFERARILTDLFGKSGAEMGRLMDGSMRKVISAAEESGAVIDRELLKKADAFDDAWAQAWLKFRAYAVSAIGFAGGLIEGLINQVARLQSSLPSGLGGFGTGGGFVPKGIGGFNERTGGTKLDIRLPGNRPLFGPAAEGATGMVIGGGIDSVLKESDLDKQARGAADKLREWKEATAKAADATASWARNLQGQFRFDQDAALLNAATSDATKKLQKMMMGADVHGGIIPSSRINIPGLFGGPADISGNAQGGAGGLGAGSLVRPTSFGASLEGAFSALPEVILGALQGGGDLKRSIGSLLGGSLLGSGTGINKAITGGISGLFGDKIGKFASSLLPGIGALIGPAITGLTKLFGGLFGAEGKKTNRARDAAISDFTGIEGDKGASQAKFRELATAAGIANAELDKLFSTKKTKDFESAMDSISRKISTFTNEQEADQQRLAAAIDKYGFTIEQLGPSLQKQRLDDQAKELIEDWRVLIGAGVEITAVNQNMSEAINAYLQTAMRLGQEVPSAFRPILQKMLEQGTLTDEAGNAITDLEGAGIHFSETMTEGFDKVVKKLDELIEKLGIASIQLGALPAVPSSLIADTSGLLQSDLAPITMAAGGGGRVTQPTLFLAGERGPEDVAFSGANRGFSGGSPEVVAAIESLEARFASFMRVMPMALRDAVLLAR